MTGHHCVPRLRRDQRGDSDVAAIIVVVPLALAVVLLFVLFGREGAGAEGVTHAAAVAARAASLERSAGAAEAAAVQAASSTLATARISAPAARTAVAVSASEWAPGGVVSVTVTCRIAGMGAIGAGDRSVSGSARATIDRFREFGS